MTDAIRRSLTAYDDLASPAEMRADCDRAGSRLGLTGVARDALRPAPSIRFEDCPQGLPKQDIDMLQAARRLATALDLELD